MTEENPQIDSEYGGSQNWEVRLVAERVGENPHKLNDGDDLNHYDVVHVIIGNIAREREQERMRVQETDKQVKRQPEIAQYYPDAELRIMNEAQLNRPARPQRQPPQRRRRR